MTARRIGIGVAAVVVLLVGVALAWREWSIHPTGGGSSAMLRLPVLSATAISTLDPVQSVEIAQYDLCNQIFEGLVKVGTDGKLGGGLASHWSSSADFKVWHFYLRDATFADDPAFAGGRGRKVTARDVIYSLLRGLSPQQGSKGSFALSRDVLGAAEYAQGAAAGVSGLQEIGPDVVEIELKKGNRFFPAALTVPSTYVVPAEAVTRYGTGFGRHPVGSGPYRLARWDEGRVLILERNANYGKGVGIQPSPAAIEEVEFDFFRSEAQMAGAFSRGQIDVRPIIASDLAKAAGNDFKAALQNANPDAKLVEPGWILKLQLLAVQFGDDHALGTRSDARRALLQLLALKLADVNAFRGLGEAEHQILPSRFLSAPVPPPFLSNPEEVLKAAVAGKQIRIAYPSSRVNDVVVQILSDVLTDAGAKPVLFPSTSVNALFGSLGATKPDLTLIYWSPYVPTISEFLTALETSSQPVPNFTGFSSTKLDSLAEALRSTNRPAEAVAADIQKELDGELPWIPLYRETPLYLTSARVQGFALSPVSVTQLAAMRLR
jgi:ABC-type transport system substrate-binding protein